MRLSTAHSPACQKALLLGTDCCSTPHCLVLRDQDRACDTCACLLPRRATGLCLTLQTCTPGRLADAQHARERWGADRLLCCPIPVSLGTAIARLPLDDDAAPGTTAAAEAALGVVTLGLRSGAGPSAE